jgi:hypothetical protein
MILICNVIVTCGVENNAAIQVKELEDLCIYFQNSHNFQFCYKTDGVNFQNKAKIPNEGYLKLNSDLKTKKTIEFLLKLLECLC